MRRSLAWPRRTVALLLLVAAATGLGACARRDLGGLCKLAQEVLAEPRIPAEQRYARFMEQVRSAAFSPSTRELMDGLADLPPAQRYERVLAFARERGEETWSCPALRSVLGSDAPPKAP